jgi:SAM-dependent methyltransferase
VQTVHTWCVVCGSDDPRPYQRSMYALRGRSFDLVRCAACGFVYVDPRPDGETLEGMYDDEDYYTEGYNLGVETESYFERREELLAQYDGEVEALEREVGGPASLLELGSAGGFFIEAARRRGWSVRGVELSPVAASFSIEELGLEVFEGQLELAPFPPESFDVCVADNVLEHTTDPLAVLGDLTRLLRPGGHLVVVVPTYVNSAFFRAARDLGRWLPRRLLGPKTLRLLKLDPSHDGGAPYHILEFDRGTLLRLLGRAGFELVSARGSVPRPAHLFKAATLSPAGHLQRLAFVVLDGLMRLGLLPGARLRVVARKPG